MELRVFNVMCIDDGDDDDDDEYCMYGCGRYSHTHHTQPTQTIKRDE